MLILYEINSNREINDKKNEPCEIILSCFKYLQFIKKSMGNLILYESIYTYE